MSSLEIENLTDDESELQKIVDKMEYEYIQTQNTFISKITELKKRNETEEERFSKLMKEYFELKEQSEDHKKQVASLMETVMNKYSDQPKLSKRSPQKTGVFSPSNQQKITSQSPKRNGVYLRKSFGGLVNSDQLTLKKETQSPKFPKKEEKGRWKAGGSPKKVAEKKTLNMIR